MQLWHYQQLPVMSLPVMTLPIIATNNQLLLVITALLEKSKVKLFFKGIKNDLYHQFLDFISNHFQLTLKFPTSEIVQFFGIFYSSKKCIGFSPFILWNNCTYTICDKICLFQSCLIDFWTCLICIQCWNIILLFDIFWYLLQFA